MSFITEAPPNDEHPAANIQTGMGAPLPPRDGNPQLSDLAQCFTFG